MNDRTRTVAYWILTALTALMLAGSGFANITMVPEVAASLLGLGYPEYFPPIIGAWKVAGALAILIPGFALLKEWAYAGVTFLMTGAMISHVLHGDPVVNLIGPAVILSLALGSHALRPADRRVG